MLARAGGSASAEESRKRGQGEALHSLGPGRPGRPRWSCSFQQVRRTRARSRLRSRRLLRWSRFAGKTLAIGPALPSSRRAASSALLPSPGGSALPPALPGEAEGARAPTRFSTASGTAPAPRRVLPWGQRSLRRTAPAGSSSGSVRAQHHGRGGQSSAPAGSVPRVSTVAADSSRRAPASQRTANKDRGLAGASRVPWEWVVVSVGVFRLPPGQCQGRSGEGAQSYSRVSCLGSAVRQGLAVQWRVPAGSRKEVGRGDGHKRSWATAGQAGPRLRGRSAPSPPSSKSPPPRLARDRGLPSQMPKAGSCNR